MPQLKQYLPKRKKERKEERRRRREKERERETEKERQRQRKRERERESTEIRLTGRLREERDLEKKIGRQKTDRNTPRRWFFFFCFFNHI